MLTLNAWAQGPIKRPSDERLELPSFKPPGQEEGQILPRIPLPKQPDTKALEAEQRVYIRVYYFTDNTALTDGELLKIAKPYTNREITFSELAELRDRVTLAYIERGYLNSGAVIPPQQVRDGVLRIQIVEGSLSEIDIETDGRFRESFLRDRIRRSIDRPLNVNALEERLQILQQDDRIRHIQATLLPGKTRGESRLKMDVSENEPLRVRFQADNYEHPSVGAESGRMFVTHNNLSGYGDRISVNYSRTEGSWDAGAYYVLPINAYDTALELNASRSEDDVIEEPIPDVDTVSDYETYGLTLRQPIVHTLESTVEVFLSAEKRRSETRFHLPEFLGDHSIDSKVNVLRFGQDWTLRGGRQALALRSMFSYGLDILGATKRSGDQPDSRFLVWLGQVQWVRRIQTLESQFIFRTDLQYSMDPLLGMEQFAVGGHASVRGYRENTLIRDNGGIVSIEFRIPVWGGLSRMDLGVFYDAGRGWNKGTSFRAREGKTLTSAGLGLHGQIGRRLSFRFEWAKSFQTVPESDNDDLQDKGVYFQVATEF